MNRGKKHSKRGGKGGGGHKFGCSKQGKEPGQGFLQKWEEGNKLRGATD